MARLIYIINLSLDGYFEDAGGNIGWTDPDDEQFRFITDLVRPAGTYLYGRRMYESMLVWETDPNLAAESPIYRDFAEMWQVPEKIVYSRALEAVPTRKTRIERSFNPEAVRQLKETADRDILIGGPELAAHAFRSGLIDECQLFIAPIILGGGKQALPGNVRVALKLLEERRFGNGVVFLRYETRQG